MMLYSTSNYGGTNCSTGCPYCGCSNPNCRYGGTAAPTTNYAYSFTKQEKKQVSVYKQWVLARSLVGMLAVNDRRKQLLVVIRGRQVGSPRSSRWSRYRKATQ